MEKHVVRVAFFVDVEVPVYRTENDTDESFMVEVNEYCENNVDSIHDDALNDVIHAKKDFQILCNPEEGYSWHTRQGDEVLVV